MKTMTVAEFRSAVRAQGVSRREDYAFKCPVCHTVQSMQSLINAGAGKTAEDVEQYVGFSCVGRFTKAGPYRATNPTGIGCDWTLGGFLHLHELVIVDEAGQRHMHFEPASDFEAQALAIANMQETEAGQ